MNIEHFLQDCYAIDPSLKEHEPELRRAIEKLIAAKPDARPDADFVARLRNEVVTNAGRMSASPMNDLRTFFSMRWVAPVGALTAVVLLILVTSPGGKTPIGDVAPGDGASSTVAAREGFGPLATAQGVNPAALSARGFGGGGGVGLPMAMSEDADAKMMIAPVDYVQYRFVYDGEFPELPADVTVLRRIKGFSGIQIPNISGGDVMDLSALSNTRLQSLAIVEDREFGLMAYIDALEGTINLSQNWQKWPHPEQQCVDEACWAQYRMSPEDVPSDEAVIEVADRFMDEYGISREGLGTPEVRNEWCVMYAASIVKEGFTAPDTLSVVYPFVMEGTAAVDESGTSAGIQVNVNLRHMRVDGAWNMSTLSFDRSTYTGETDAERIMKFVNQGGLYAWYDPNVKIVDVQLGAPELVYLRSWKAREDGTSDDLFVPALRFMVLDKPADQPWFRNAVVIPLAKDLLDLADEQNNGGVITPMGRGGVEPTLMVAPELVDPPVSEGEASL